MVARPTPRRALLACTGVLALLVWAIGVAAAVVPTDLVELEVLGVVPLESESTSILVLRQKGARTLLPIFVGRAEGDEIDGRMRRRSWAGPGRSADLLRRSIEALGGKVVRVVIDGASGRPFRARVALDQGSSRRDVEARPSDSIALALASRAPIYATRTVIAESGLSEQELGALNGGSKPSRRDDDAAPGHVESF